MNETVQTLINKDLADACLLTSVKNVSYATGFSGDSSQLLITAAETYFFTDSRYTLQAEKDIADSIEIITTDGTDRIPMIADMLKKNGINTLAIEKDDLTVNAMLTYEEAFEVDEYLDISGILLKMRSRKTEAELEKIRIAAIGNETVLDELVKRIVVGMSEYEVKAELTYQIYRCGMEPSFDPIVAAGKNSALPHATTTMNRLRPGDMLTLDFGCTYMGYCSDITRTFGIGDVDGQAKKIYYIVKSAQEAALDAAKSGERASGIDGTAREVIEKNGYGEYFSHSTGHGVGLDVHELPLISRRSENVIEDNMVFTIEPGIYIPGCCGVRIEDMCTGEDGSFYTFSKDLILI